MNDSLRKTFHDLNFGSLEPASRLRLHKQINLKKRLIQFIAGIVMFSAAVVGVTASATTQNENVATENNIAEVVMTVPSEASEYKSTEERVREYFADIPILIDVAKCESRFRQFDSNGNPLLGIANSDDVGVMQINKKYHQARANQLGYNLNTLEGNMAYGRQLYEEQGTGPWEYSSKCWGKTREVALNTL